MKILGRELSDRQTWPTVTLTVELMPWHWVVGKRSTGIVDLGPCSLEWGWNHPPFTERNDVAIGIWWDETDQGMREYSKWDAKLCQYLMLKGDPDVRTTD